MAKINDKLLSELERLVANCTMKREMLLQSALSKAKVKKALNITSGVLALLSAGAITTVLVKYFGNETLQIIAALTAAISGFISLLITAYYVEEETSKIFEGSSKYLSLRDKAYRLLINPNASNEQVFNDLANLQSEYAQYDGSYSKYTRYKKSLRPRSKYSSQIPPSLSRQQKKVDQAIDVEMKNFDKEVASLKKQNGKQE
jgi:hypothetical protein